MLMENRMRGNANVRLGGEPGVSRGNGADRKTATAPLAYPVSASCRRLRQGGPAVIHSLAEASPRIDGTVLLRFKCGSAGGGPVEPGARFRIP